METRPIVRAVEPAGFNEPDGLDGCLTPRELGRFLKVSDATVAVILASGELPSFKAKGSRRVLCRDLLDWVERSKGVQG